MPGIVSGEAYPTNRPGPWDTLRVIEGGEASPRGPWLTSAPAGPTVAGALTIAGVLAVGTVVGRVAGLFGASFSARLDYAGFVSFPAMGLLLAAAVALTGSEPPQVGPDTTARWPVWAYNALGLLALAGAAASLWGLFQAFAENDLADGAFSMMRFAFAATELTPLALAIGVVVIVARTRRRMHPVAADARTDGAHVLFAEGLIGPTVVFLLASEVVSLAVGVDAAFRPNLVSAGDRLGAAAVNISQIPGAFVAFAVVVLIAVGRGARDREVATVAGVCGLVVTVAAAYSVWAAVTLPTSSAGPLLSLLENGWTRFGAVTGALAAGAIAIITASLARRLRTRETVGVSNAPARDVAPFHWSRTDARVTATFIAAAAAGYATYAVLTALNLRDLGLPFHPSFGDLVVAAAGFAPAVGGLALAALLVMVSSRPDVTGRDGLNDALDAVLAILAVAVVAASTFSIWSILLEHHAAGMRLFVAPGTADHLRSAGNSVAAVLIGVAAIHLIVRGRRIAADRETERELAALERLS